MIVRIIFTLLITVLMAGCSPSYVDYFPYHDDGRAKPKIVLLPLIDDVRCFCWDITQELGQSLRFQTLCNGSLFVISDEEVASRLENCDSQNYFSPDISFAQRFCGADYVVALELIDHSFVPYQRGMCQWVIPPQKYHWRSVLVSKVRLRIIDVRCVNPRLVLQEVLVSYYPLPTDKECIDYSKCCWGTEAYLKTPLAKAHDQLSWELVCRIESVIKGP